MAIRGRPRSFDRDLALRRAMEVFWEKGYEGAQLRDLTAAMGVAPPSFYAAFGSKEAAFREAVELYVATVGAKPIRALDEADTARAGIRAMLAGSAEVALASRSGGCLLILGVVNCLPETDALRELLKAMRRTTLDRVRKRLRRGVREGDLPANTDTKRLATFYSAIMQAISLRARDGATRAELGAVIGSAMAALA
ncbi:transcriptional regulator, TetR family [Rhizobiales bacterium GAS113]|nr:transcriptional regulator, TetR family [Rhizobiales bacterium GAS113]